MKLNGTYTQHVEVEVNPWQIIDKTCELLENSLNLRNRIIDKEGYWQELDYIHPHNGDETYKKTNLKPTEDEIKAMEVILYLRKIKHKIKE